LVIVPLGAVAFPVTVSPKVIEPIGYLPIVPDEATASLLKGRGHFHVSVRVRFTPDAGVGRIKEKDLEVRLGR
jgi:hypothetical protein